MQSQSQILFWKALLSTLVGPEYKESPVFKCQSLLSST